MSRLKLLKCGYVGMVATVIAASACSPPPAGDAGVDVPNANMTDTFRADTFRPVVDTFVPPADTFMPPADTFVPPVDDTFVPPADVPNADVPNADVPNFDVPNFDVPNVDVPNPRPDVPPGVDVPSDVPPAPGCGLMVEPAALAVPAAGMTTTVMTTLNAMGMGGMNAGTSCQADARGSERIFRLTLAAPTTVILAATAMNAGTDTILAIRRNCASSATEAACDDDSGPGTNSLIRRTLPAGDYFVVLDEYAVAPADAAGGPVTLTLQTVTPAANATCAGAIPLMAGVAANGNTNLTGGELAPNMCSAFNSGPELYYSFTIPANSSATFTAVPSGMPAWTPFVRVFNACASQDVCTATGSGNAMLRNATMNPVTVFVTVGSSAVDNGGAFALTATTAMIPNTAYTMAPMAMASCDDLGMVMRDAVLVGDDVATPFAALPFAFTYHRVAATHFAASTNGFLQLGVMGDTSASALTNLALPAAAGPTGIVAVFWDDQFVRANPQGVRQQVLGAMPNRRFVTEWNVESFGAANSLRYQVKLFETTNVIEYHYCAMTGVMGNASTRHTGTEATIGLQSRDRMQGQMFSNNLLNAIGAGSMPVTNMIRWTPNP